MENITPMQAEILLKTGSLKPKIVAQICLSAMDVVETYWASNNEEATRKANDARRKFREILEGKL